MKYLDSIRHIIHTDTAKNSAKLLSANVMAQAIGLIIYPIITRLYSPEDFGLFNLFSSIGGILVLLATAEYQYAIVLPKRDKDAIALFQTGCFIALAVTALITLTIPFRHKIAGLFNTPELADWYFLLPLFVAGSALWNLLNYWLTRKKQFSNISIYQLSQSIISAGSKYFFGISGFLAGGLIVSSVIGCISAFIVSLTMALRKYAMQFAHVSISRCKHVAKKYANFPKFSLARALVNQFFGQIPVLLLTPVFGTSSIGYWSMAILLAFTPVNMISRSVYQVLFQKMNQDAQNQRSLTAFYKKTVIYTILIAGAGSCILFPFLPTLTQWLLGDNWNISGIYIRYMLPWLTFSLIVASTGFIPDLFFKQRTGLFFEILLATARLIGVLIGIFAHNFTIAIAGYAFGSAIVTCTQLGWFWSLIRRYDQRISEKIS